MNYYNNEGAKLSNSTRPFSNKIKTSAALRWLEHTRIPSRRVEQLNTSRGPIALPLQNDWQALLNQLYTLATVSVITRNPHATIEQKTDFQAIRFEQQRATLHNNNLNLQFCFGDWQSGFAISESTPQGISHGFRFYDKNGNETHQINLTSESNFAAYEAIKITFADHNAPLTSVTTPIEQTRVTDEQDRHTLCQDWLKLQTPLELDQTLQQLGLQRLQAFQLAGADFAYPVDIAEIGSLLHVVNDADLHLCLGVRNPGALQIHCGHIEVIQETDEGHLLRNNHFKMNLNLNKAHSAWVVRTPHPKGETIALELYGNSEQHIALIYADPSQPKAHHWQQLMAHLTPLQNG
ncbi:MAG: ChuX/HutX family heme-like substrate-binding protein [Gammaproteobacteria bacterium]|nr:ChuX/HutX family heme-like substrate-binding protein [Gammaproteobacteria bacterium]